METWKTVPDFEGRYQASSEGRIRSLVCGIGVRSRPLVLKLQPTRDGYIDVCLTMEEKKQTKRGVHRLVCMAFHGLPPAEGMEAAHVDGDKTNNRPENLRWLSAGDNNREKSDHGTQLRGSEVSTAKLTEDQVLRIRSLKKSGASNVSLGKQFGVSDRMIGKIVKGDKWKHLPL